MFPRGILPGAEVFLDNSLLDRICFAFCKGARLTLLLPGVFPSIVRHELGQFRPFDAEAHWLPTTL